jgi:transposase
MSASPAEALPTLAAETDMLDNLARSRTTPHRQGVRAKVLLMAADGVAKTRIAEKAGVTVGTWRQRFGENGLVGLGQVRKGRGRKSTIIDEQVAQIVRLATEEAPSGHRHWSCRTMADGVGVSHSAVQRIWLYLGIKPQRMDTSEVSTDPELEDEPVDDVGFYLNPSEKTIVL